MDKILAAVNGYKSFLAVFLWVAYNVAVDQAWMLPHPWMLDVIYGLGGAGLIHKWAKANPPK
jgi:hypothetical protein